MLKISVIITTYNSGSVIRRCLDSIFGQRGVGEQFELEVIAVDDCSQDETLEVLKSYPLISLQTASNTSGPNAGRNMGMRLMSGDYYCLVDHDDEWKPDRILSALPYLDGIAILSTGFTLLDLKRNIQEDRVAISDRDLIHFSENQTFVQKLRRSLSGQNTYLGGLFLHHSTREVYFEEHFGMLDYDWQLRLFYGRASAELCQSTYVRHVDGSNLSLNATYRKRDFYYSLLAIENYKAEFPSAYLRSYKKIHGSRARYHYVMREMKEARFFLRRAHWSPVNLFYYLTSFLGYNWVLKKFNVFG